MSDAVLDPSLPIESAEAAKIIGCSKDHVWELARDGKIMHYRVGRFLRFRVEDVIAYRDSLLEGGE